MNERLTLLLRRYLNQTGSEQETEELMAMIKQSEHDEQLKLMMEKEWSDFQETHPYFKDEEARDMLHTILGEASAENEETGTGIVRRISFLRRWWAAASVILVLGAGVYFWMANKKNTSPAESLAKSDIIQDVPPGRDGAILTLADGTQVLLDTIRNGMVALQGGAMARVVNGALEYEGKGIEVLYNTMTTPHGRQFSLLLPDGTRVWLNAASSIRYPTVFTGKTREVLLTGEAYFEVARNTKMPFRVNVNDRAGVEVLGTHFNVNAYEDEGSIATTLLEGSIAVAAFSSQAVLPNGRPATDAARPVVLRPGQQAQVVNAAGIKVIDNADLEKVMAWKNGLFHFEGATVKEVMRQIARWYNVEVIYTSEIRELFYGSIPRDIELLKVLEMLEKTKGVKFQIKNNSIVVVKS